jgi:IS4 transposase
MRNKINLRKSEVTKEGAKKRQKSDREETVKGKIERGKVGDERETGRKEIRGDKSGQIDRVGYRDRAQRSYTKRGQRGDSEGIYTERGHRDIYGEGT